MNKATADEAICITLGEPEAAKRAKRELFEEVAYERYLENFKASDEAGHQPMTKDQVCLRNATSMEHYHYQEMNTLWWGFQAGFTAAALAGARPLEAPTAH